jgi:organic hydroperoxide reductase OsmC/OhrA
MNAIEKVLYTAKTHTTGGRDGASRTSDGRLDIKLSSPGGAGTGTNPEQLFAAGWSACFIGAMDVAAAKMKVILPADRAIDAEVDLGTNEGGLGRGSPPQRQPAGSGSGRRSSTGRRRAPDLPILQGHTRQYRCRDQPCVNRTGRTGLPAPCGQAISGQQIRTSPGGSP